MGMSADESIHAEILGAVLTLSQREAVQMLLRPNLINALYLHKGAQLTQERVKDVKSLLAAIVRDAHHNPIAADARAQAFAEIRHQLVFLSTSDLLHYNDHPNCFVAYLVNTYADARGYLLDLQLGEIQMLEEAVTRILEVRLAR